MPRAMWRGAIQFGLVTIPVRLFLATESRGGLSFNMLHTEDHKRIQMKVHCPEHGEIKRSDTVRGYEWTKGRYVVLEESDFEQVTDAERVELRDSALVERWRESGQEHFAFLDEGALHIFQRHAEAGAFGDRADLLFQLHRTENFPLVVLLLVAEGRAAERQVLYWLFNLDNKVDVQFLEQLARRFEVMQAAVHRGLEDDLLQMQLLRPSAGQVYRAEAEGCVAIGGIHTRAAARAMEGMLFGVGSFDVPTYLAVALLLVLVAVLANLLPARKAAATQPMNALRSE